MTYQEYYEQVYKEYAEASSEFLKLDSELSKVHGFGDFMSVPNYLKAHRRWQIATNNYWGFLAFIKARILILTTNYRYLDKLSCPNWYIVTLFFNPGCRWFINSR